MTCRNDALRMQSLVCILGCACVSIRIIFCEWPFPCSKFVDVQATFQYDFLCIRFQLRRFKIYYVCIHNTLPLICTICLTFKFGTIMEKIHVGSVFLTIILWKLKERDRERSRENHAFGIENAKINFFFMKWRTVKRKTH